MGVGGKEVGEVEREVRWQKRRKRKRKRKRWREGRGADAGEADVETAEWLRNT